MTSKLGWFFKFMFLWTMHVARVSMCIAKSNRYNCVILFLKDSTIPYCLLIMFIMKKLYSNLLPVSICLSNCFILLFNFVLILVADNFISGLFFIPVCGNFTEIWTLNRGMNSFEKSRTIDVSFFNLLI